MTCANPELVGEQHEKRQEKPKRLKDKKRGKRDKKKEKVPKIIKKNGGKSSKTGGKKNTKKGEYGAIHRIFLFFYFLFFFLHCSTTNRMPGTGIVHRAYSFTLASLSKLKLFSFRN